LRRDDSDDKDIDDECIMMHPYMRHVAAWLDPRELDFKKRGKK